MNGKLVTLIRPAKCYTHTRLFGKNDFSAVGAIKNTDVIFPNNYAFWPA